MELICYLCGSRSIHVLYPASGSASTEASAYRCTSMDHELHAEVVRCGACGLEFVPPSQVNARLPDLYADVVDERYLKHREARIRTFESTYRRIEPHLHRGTGRLLEIGSYCGFFLEIARARGWNVTGVEPSRWAVRHAREEAGLDVRTGTLDDVDLPAGSFDAVVMLDVLEHLSDPVRTLRQAARLLRAGGVLCASTMDIDNWFPRLLGRHWPWRMDMHIFYFRKAIMDRFFREAGLRLTAAAPQCHWSHAEYLLEKLDNLLPAGLKWLARGARRMVPRSMFIPFRFGDVKIYICGKGPSPAAARPAIPRRSGALVGAASGASGGPAE